MTIKLKKGERINLSKERLGFSKVVVGLGWSENKPSNIFENMFNSFKKIIDPEYSGGDFDLDAVAILLQNGHFVRKKDLVFYNNKYHDSGCVKHMGDNLTGNAEGEEGDAEQIVIDLKTISPRYDRIILAVGIYQAFKRKQHFGMVKNAYIRLVDESTRREVCRYNLTDNYPDMTNVVFGELYRDDNKEWKFKAVGEGTQDENVCLLAVRYE